MNLSIFLVLVACLCCVFAVNAEVFSAEECRSKAEEVESREDPLSPEERLSRSPEHVVDFFQSGEDVYNVAIPNHPPQRIDFAEEGNGHFIEAVWIRRVGTDEVVYCRNVTRDADTINVAFRPTEALLNESLEGPVQLQAYMWCNLHGLWTSEPVTMVPPLYWRLAAGQLDGRQECPALDGVSLFTAGQMASIFLSAEPAYSRIIAEYSLPLGMYLG